MSFSVSRVASCRAAFVGGLCVWVCVLVLLALATTADLASANQMTIFSCHDPAGNGVGHDGWTIARTSDPYMSAVDTCANSNQGSLALELGVSAGGYPNLARIEWVFQAPSWATIAKYTLQVPDSYAYPSTGAGSGQDYVIASDESDPDYDYRNLGGGPRGPVTVQRTPPAPVGAITLNASCDGQNGSCPAGTRISHIDMTAGTIVLNDSTVPSVGALSGSLVSGSPLSGVAEVSFEATDSGPGVYSAWLVVDGQPQPAALLNNNNGWCANLGQTSDGTRSFAHPVPCAKSASGSLTLDTTHMSEGQHTVKLVVDDASGNATTAFSRTVVVGRATNGALGSVARWKVSLKVSPRRVHRHSTIRLIGSVATTPRPSKGKLILLQARDVSSISTGRGHRRHRKRIYSRWITFQALRAKSNGRFSSTYTFRLGGRHTYQFQAVAPAEGQYLNPTGTSKIIAIRET